VETSWLDDFEEVKQKILKKCKEEVFMRKEAVNHPDHYNQGTMEVIEAIKGLGYAEDFCIGNIIKYVTRSKHKNGLEDLKKAQWYLNYLIEMQEEQQGSKESLEEIWNKAEII
jgi:hypothetical protein